jgi:hypothetical protein
MDNAMNNNTNGNTNDKVYQVAEITGEDLNVAGRLWLSEDEALGLSDQEIILESPDGKRIKGRIVGETREQIEMERRPGGEILVKFVGRYID